MGCTNSKKSGKKQKQIDYNMEYIRSAQINQFFSSCETLLKQSEDLRSGWEDSLEEMYDISCVQFLKNPPALVDAVKVWVWTHLSNNGGDISNCNINVNSLSYVESTFIQKCSGCLNNPNIYHQGCPLNESARFKEALKIYFKACVEGSKKTPELLSQLESYLKKAKELRQQAKYYLGHLDSLEQTKNIEKIGQNVIKMTKALSVIKNLLPLIPEAVNNMEQVINEMPQILKSANEKAQLAKQWNISQSADIMYNLHPGEKQIDEQIKKMMVKAEKKRRQQQEEKKKREQNIKLFNETKNAYLFEINNSSN